MQDAEQGPQCQVSSPRHLSSMRCARKADATSQVGNAPATTSRRRLVVCTTAQQPVPPPGSGGRAPDPDLPAGSAPGSRPRPAPDDGAGPSPEETSAMPAAAAVRGITRAEPLLSHRPAAAAVNGTTPVGADPAGRPGAAGSGSTGAVCGMGRLCDVADEDTGGRRDPARGRISRARQGAARRARRRGAHGSLRRTRPRGRGVLDRAAPRTPRGRRARFLRTRVAGDDGDGRPALRPFGRPRRRSGES